MIVNRLDFRVVNGGAFGVGFQLLEAAAFDPLEVKLAVHSGDKVLADIIPAKPAP